jgi:2-amino-4-hydroxy-6-hydroxymethyldihydropteridine diphosphokinase
MTQPASACIGIGSNLGDRCAIITSALAAFADVPGVEVLAVSGVIETDPVGPPGQGKYLNAAAVLRTTLSPRALLDAMLAIEKAHGRERLAGQRWGPRRLDLDLLLYDDRVMSEAGVSVPHPRMHERLFVLEPLAEIAPDLVHPVLCQSIRSLRDRLIQTAASANAIDSRSIGIP